MALLVVGIGDCKVSQDPSDVLVTHGLGSCIAVLLYDPRARVAGLLHYMLPESSLDPEGAGKRPCLFADTGIPLLLQSACQLGAVKSRMVIVAAGGAQMLDPTGSFNVGRRNYLAMLKIFERDGIRIYKEAIGGTCSRTVSIDVAGGRVQLRTPGHAKLDLFVAEGSLCCR
jgi:chemotaxis protein CheD